MPKNNSCVTRLERTAGGVLGQVNESERVEDVSDRQLALNRDSLFTGLAGDRR
jgi:hypothetical protein